MKLNLSKRSAVIISIILFVVFASSGGYLLWRINQDDTVAPTDSDASECPDGCYWHAPTNACVGQLGCAWACSGSGCSYFPPFYDDDGNLIPGRCAKSQTEVGSCENGSLECDPCETDDDDDDDGSCASIPNVGDTGPAGSSCDSSNCGGSCGVYTYKCGTLCYDASCGASACGYTPPAATTYTLHYSAGANGTVTGSLNQTVEEGASGTAVTAVPNTGAVFNSWSDGSTANPRTDTNVQANKSVVANFTLGTYTLTYRAETNGTISGTAVQSVSHGGSGSSVTAMPNSGYYFVKWSDNRLTAQRTDTNITSNVTFTASFSLNCGNGICSAIENSENCPTDCPATCGDGYCTHEENPLTCPEDCESICGDNICSANESNFTCPDDCEGTNGGVPQTGIFDDSKNVVVLGAILLFVGISWSWIVNLSKEIYIGVGRYLEDGKKGREERESRSRKEKLEKRMR